MDKIRVIKLLIYEGPRDVVEAHLQHTVNGTRWQTMHLQDISGEYSITGINIAQFPEILESNINETESNKE